MHLFGGYYHYFTYIFNSKLLMFYKNILIKKCLKLITNRVDDGDESAANWFVRGSWVLHFDHFVKWYSQDEFYLLGHLDDLPVGSVFANSLLQFVWCPELTCLRSRIYSCHFHSLTSNHLNC